MVVPATSTLLQPLKDHAEAPPQTWSVSIRMSEGGAWRKPFLTAGRRVAFVVEETAERPLHAENSYARACTPVYRVPAPSRRASVPRSSVPVGHPSSARLPARTPAECPSYRRDTRFARICYETNGHRRERERVSRVSLLFYSLSRSDTPKGWRLNRRDTRDTRDNRLPPTSASR